ncbi:hypothetical protein RvY_17275 [Ramazzottius varieornatus]|uniref:Uncharacterized protein n=1 Tax=Ramazzottius varieornatus TaxID=947166 RepID=A0A1D1W1J6_RAMVA|nr:hypothetical protein RvY_17275 [Ramazzottius varieornatus]
MAIGHCTLNSARRSRSPARVNKVHPDVSPSANLRASPNSTNSTAKGMLAAVEIAIKSAEYSRGLKE